MKWIKTAQNMRKLCNKIALLLSLAFFSSANAGECVILLHGLARTSSSFETLSNTLTAKGYKTFNVDYESRKFDIATLANQAIDPTLKQTAECEKIHFVTHSMGGILVRQYLKSRTIAKLGKVVMLGPPNHGSEVVDQLKNWSIFQYINGPAGSELGTDSLSTPNQLGRPSFELGIIAGDRSINWINSLMIDGPDDGKVSVNSTKLVGMSDHIVIHTTHPMMMDNKEVIKQVLWFLVHGKFEI
jgi:uncharacterized alpha/beta hydrolase family protein